MEIMTYIFLFKIPIPNNPLGSTNVYLIKSSNGDILIDTGWNSDESFIALQEQIAEADSKWDDLRYIVLTHAHPDHSGLLDRIAQIARPVLVIHSIELGLLKNYIGNAKMVAKGMAEWMLSNGLPPLTDPQPAAPHRNIIGYTPGNLPEWAVNDGDRLCFGEFDFELLWSPGHAPGHLCLYERSRELLFAGDHLLMFTTPNVSKYSQMGNPLNDYLRSLQKLSGLPVKLVLPGHGPSFTHLVERVAEIEIHHHERTAAIEDALEIRPLNAFEVSAVIPWSTDGVPWDKLPTFMQQMAIAETVAHLDYLETEGKVTQFVDNGVIRYARVD